MAKISLLGVEDLFSILGIRESMKHIYVSGRFICDRGVLAELTRHRLASYTVESTRFCNYKGGVSFIIPSFVQDVLEGPYDESGQTQAFPFARNLRGISGVSPSSIWFYHVLDSERNYLSLLNEGWIPQQARAVLPNSLKTEIVVTANLKEWQHIFTLRCAPTAHPDMVHVMKQAFEQIYNKFPTFFQGIKDSLKL